MTTSEPEAITAFKAWFSEHGGVIHEDVKFTKVASGFSVTASESIPADSVIFSCPFALAITPDVSRKAINKLLKIPEDKLMAWTERQLISAYISLHWLLPESSEGLAHGPYVKILPSADQLLTSLHFKEKELEAFKGSNLYGATIDRRKEWQAEWTQCKAAAAAFDPALEDRFKWEMYLTAATHLSSRAFISNLLSPNPSLEADPSSHPVLLPGIDSANHARAHPVSWIVNYPKEGESAKGPSISLSIHAPTSAGQEILNNYGVKPNAELILGYGFSLPENPDDTIVLKIGGTISGQSEKLGVGRKAKGAEAVWTEVFELACQDDKSENEEDEEDPKQPYENTLQAAQTLASMIEGLIDRLPSREVSLDLRPEVAQMFEHYLEGQYDVLQGMLHFAEAQEKKAVDDASAQGIELVFDD